MYAKFSNSTSIVLHTAWDKWKSNPFFLPRIQTFLQLTFMICIQCRKWRCQYRLSGLCMNFLLSGSFALHSVQKSGSHIHYSEWCAFFSQFDYLVLHKVSSQCLHLSWKLFDILQSLLCLVYSVSTCAFWFWKSDFMHFGWKNIPSARCIIQCSPFSIDILIFQATQFRLSIEVEVVYKLFLITPRFFNHDALASLSISYDPFSTNNICIYMKWLS